MAENNSHRKLCVVWTTVEKVMIAFEHNTRDVFTDYYITFEEGEEEEERAKALYEEVLQKENIFCASLCKILKDSEA